MSDDLVVYEKEGRIAWLTLNRPEALNAINLDLRDLLWVLLEAVRDDPDVGVVIFRGAGERAFCAGADVEHQDAPRGARVGLQLDRFGTDSDLRSVRRPGGERSGESVRGEEACSSSVHGGLGGVLEAARA